LVTVTSAPDPGSKLSDRRNGKQKSNRQPYRGKYQNATEMTHGNLRNAQNVGAAQTAMEKA